MALWTVQTSEAVLNRIVIEQQVAIERFDEGVKKAKEELVKITETSAEDFRIPKLEKRIETFSNNSKESEEFLEKITSWHTPTTWVLAICPKNAQTIGLLQRWLNDPDGFDITAIMAGDMRSIEGGEDEVPYPHPDPDGPARAARERETMRRMVDEYDSNSLWYVVGTSLLFEGVILGLASLYFCRKDF